MGHKLCPCWKMWFLNSKLMPWVMAIAFICNIAYVWGNLCFSWEHNVKQTWQKDSSCTIFINWSNFNLYKLSSTHFKYVFTVLTHRRQINAFNEEQTLIIIMRNAPTSLASFYYFAWQIQLLSVNKNAQFSHLKI